MFTEITESTRKSFCNEEPDASLLRKRKVVEMFVMPLFIVWKIYLLDLALILIGISMGTYCNPPFVDVATSRYLVYDLLKNGTVVFLSNIISYYHRFISIETFFPDSQTPFNSLYLIYF